ncbi:hypothetical protein [Nocardia sp. NBC_00416]|uniref:hypothetical protein n=1 Tax=Nocardia sp. NBC_00416 TaxID=2975991 RepID=UPI002E2460F8
MNIVRVLGAVGFASMLVSAPLMLDNDVVSPAAAQAAGCGGRAWAAPLNQFGPVADSSCSVAGHPGYEMCYNIKIEGNGLAVVHARGYDINGNEQWYSIPTSYGCVPWGNSLAMPAIKATSPNVTGVFVSFSH